MTITTINNGDVLFGIHFWPDKQEVQPQVRCLYNGIVGQYLHGGMSIKKFVCVGEKQKHDNDPSFERFYRTNGRFGYVYHEEEGSQEWLLYTDMPTHLITRSQMFTFGGRLACAKSKTPLQYMSILPFYRDLVSEIDRLSKRPKEGLETLGSMLNHRMYDLLKQKVEAFMKETYGLEFVLALFDAEHNLYAWELRPITIDIEKCCLERSRSEQNKQ